MILSRLETKNTCREWLLGVFQGYFILFDAKLQGHLHQVKNFPLDLKSLGRSDFVPIFFNECTSNTHGFLAFAYLPEPTKPFHVWVNSIISTL